MENHLMNEIVKAALDKGAEVIEYEPDRGFHFNVYTKADEARP
jgi:hypothetical protein